MHAQVVEAEFEGFGGKGVGEVVEEVGGWERFAAAVASSGRLAYEGSGCGGFDLGGGVFGVVVGAVVVYLCVYYWLNGFRCPCHGVSVLAVSRFEERTGGAQFGQASRASDGGYGSAFPAVAGKCGRGVSHAQEEALQIAFQVFRSISNEDLLWTVQCDDHLHVFPGLWKELFLPGSVV